MTKKIVLIAKLRKVFACISSLLKLDAYFFACVMCYVWSNGLM